MVTDRPTLAKIYGSRTMLVLLALGLSGGIPNVLVNNIAPAWTTLSGWSVEAIGLIALFQLPYALKFIWAPLVDRLGIPLFEGLGRRRSWLLLSQTGVMLGIGLVALWGPGDWSETQQAHAWIFMALLGVTVFLSATQDIVADAYRVEVLKRDELAAGAGVFVSGYRVAYVALGAGVLLAEKHIGWPTAIALLALVGAVGPIATLFAREAKPYIAPEAGLRDMVFAPFSSLWKQWGARILVLMVFVLVFRLPDQLANAMTPPLLLKGLGYTTEQLGWVRQAFGFALTILGALTGGWMVARWGLMRCLIAFGILQAASNGGFLLLAQLMGASTQIAREIPAPVAALLPVIAVENFAGGLVTAGFVAYLMSVCQPRHVATQYALLTALMALSGSIAGAISGVLTRQLDYPLFFLVTIFAGIPGLALIAFVRPPDSQLLGSEHHDT